MTQRTRSPTKKQIEFARCKALGMTDKDAARMAGYKIDKIHGGLRHGKFKAVQPVMQHIQSAIIADAAKRGVYDARRMMEELEKAVEFAEHTENATAYVRAIEMKGKLMGLLVDRSENKQVGNFSIRIAGIDDDPPKEAIDVTPQEVPAEEPAARKGLFDDE